MLAAMMEVHHATYLSESDFDELPTAVFNADFALLINNCYDVSLCCEVLSEELKSTQRAIPANDKIAGGLLPGQDQKA
eukprot:1154197-Pelagomonas_calceolata.AAC.3